MGALLGAFDAYIVELKKRINEEVANAKRRAYSEFFAIADMRVKEIFQEVVSGWYGEYTPNIYGRNESMFDVLETDVGEDYFGIEFNPNAMTIMNNGYTVYELTFKSGYHGGAQAPDGVMRYRAPVPFYTRWWSAASASRPPYEEMLEKCDAYAKGEGLAQLREIYRRNLRSIKLVY